MVTIFGETGKLPHFFVQWYTLNINKLTIMINDTLQKQLGALTSLFLVVATVLLAALTISTVNKMKNPAPMQNMITVNGFGKTSVAPNLAVITFGVRSEKATTEEAQANNTEVTNKLMVAVKGLGIEAKDLKTQNYSLYENTTWNPTTGKQESLGWIVYQNLEIKVRDNAKVSEVLALAGKYGVTDVNGPNFQLDDTSAYKSDARTAAIADAKTQADQLAKQLGVHLGEVTGYSEWENTTPYPMYAYADSSMGEKGGGGAPEIAPGETEVGLNVSITYLLK